MSDQDIEKKQSENQTESVEEDYGLKKLTIYTLFISITCLVIAGVWYKKDEIPFVAMYDTTVEFYNISTDTLSDSYDYIVDNFYADKSVIQESVTVTESNTATSNETITKDVIVLTNEEVETVSIEEIKTSEITNIEIVKSPETVTIEDPTENVIQGTNINEEVTEPLTVSVIESAKPPIETATKEIDISVSETPVIESLEVTGNVSNKVTTETPIFSNSITRTPVVPGHVVNVPPGYGYSTYPYNAVNSGMMVNRLPRNIKHQSNLGYMSQGYLIEQQRRTFEQNMRIQQQMMQQAFRMQSAILKDADRRHQDMLKRVANWKAESQKRREFNKTAPFVNSYPY